MTDIATEPDSLAVPATRHLPGPLTARSDDADVVEEVLVEEVSIDGMCGVY